MTKVAIIYHFFPHYRKSIMFALADNFEEVLFVGDSIEKYDGIEALRFRNTDLFKPAKCYRIGGFTIQPGVVSLALNSNSEAFIFLADVHFITTWIAAAILRMRGRKVLFWGHGFLAAGGNRYSRFFKRHFFKLCDYFLAYGNRGLGFWEQEGLDPAKYFSFYNSITLEPIDHELRKKLQPNGEQATITAPNIVAISRLTKAANYSLLIEAARILQLRNIDFKLIFIGDGPERRTLEKLCQEWDIPHTFHGALYDEGRIAPLMLNARCVVSPGKVGLTAMHAMAYARPIVSHSDMDYQMPEAEAIVDGKTGVHFERNNSLSLANSLEKLLTDAELAKSIGNNARQVIDTYYNSEYQVQLLKAILEK